MRCLVLFIVLILSGNSFCASVPSHWRLGLSLGQSQLNFKERRNSLTFSEVNIRQASYVFDASFGYFLFAPSFQLKSNLHILTPNSVENYNNTNEQKGISIYEADIGFSWSMFTLFRLLNISVETEYFYSTTFTEADAFGYKALSGFQLYPSFQLRLAEDDGATRFSIFSRIPLLSDVGNREELTLGLVFWVPFAGNSRFPLYAYEKSLLIKIIYSSIQLEYDDPSYFTGTVDLEKTYLSLGLSF